VRRKVSGMIESARHSITLSQHRPATQKRKFEATLNGDA
jgi:hypothetical protein